MSLDYKLFFAARDGSSQAAIPEQPLEANWKRVLRIVFAAFFWAVWLEGAGFFYYFEVTYGSGSPHPTVTQTAELSNHGEFVYITPAQKSRIQLLEVAMIMGIPSAMVTALVLHFVLGVKIWRRAY